MIFLIINFKIIIIKINLNHQNESKLMSQLVPPYFVSGQVRKNLRLKYDLF